MLRDKTPAAKKDYSWDWTPWLAGDTIAAHSVTLAGDLQLVSSGRVGNVVTVVVEGGTVGQFPVMHCEVTTTAGLKDSRSITLHIVPAMAE